MAPIALSDLVSALPKDPTWGPPTSTETTLEGVPYAPFSKGDKLGRMADWTSEGKDRERGGRQGYGRGYRDQQTYGAGTTQLFNVGVAEDESSFSVVDNTRTSTRGTRTFGRGGNAVFRGRGRGGAAGQNQRGGRGGPGTFQRVGQRQQQNQQYDNRGRGGGAGGRGGRRFGWKDYDKPQRNRDPSVTVRADWALMEEVDFPRLMKLNFDPPEGEEVGNYGFLHYYDRAFDKQPGAKTAERKLNVMERAAYNVTTSTDPIIQELADKNAAQIFTTDSILSMLMCAPRSVYSWDVIIERRGKQVFIDKREGSALDMVTVNENAADAPLELSEGNKDTINAPAALMMEATHINQAFPLAVVSEQSRRDMENPNPFYSADSETDPPASKAYKYRRFDMASEGSEEPLHVVVRTELDACVRNALAPEDQLLTVHALNEFDNKAQGSGGALDWRSKLASQRGAVVATEMKNNSCKLARWTTQAILANADMMKLGFVSRVTPRDTNHHVILGTLGYKPREFAAQMNLNIGNGWGIVRAVVDMVLGGLGEGKDDTRQKFVLVKDPNKALLRLYEVPLHTFEDDGDEEDGIGADGAGADGDGDGE